MKLLLHIGKEKTGSTALQSFIFDNLKNLKQNRIYPLRELVQVVPNRSFAIMFEDHFKLPIYREENVKTEKSFLELKKIIFNDFKAQYDYAIRNKSAFLVSSEILSSRLLTKKQVQNLKKFCDRFFTQTTVICYFRDQFSDSLSRYSEALKAGIQMDYPEYLEYLMTKTNILDHYQFSRLWANEFGNENFLPFNYFTTEGFPISIEEHFNKVFFDNICAINKDVSKKINASMGWARSELYKKLNRKVTNVSVEERAKLINHVQNTAKIIDSISLEAMYSDYRTNVEEHFKESNDAFKIHFLHGRDLNNKKLNSSMVQNQILEETRNKIQNLESNLTLDELLRNNSVKY